MITNSVNRYQDLRIVFMGTPDFAVAALDALVKAGCKIVGVITAPDKPAGRGLKLQQSAVKKYAVENCLHILQPDKLKNPEFITKLKLLKADLQVVVAFRMLPEVVWSMAPMGSVNLHGSLLPQYRGSAPINWAVINGEKKTGVTTFKLTQEIDTGDILLQESFSILENDNAGDVHHKMKEIGSQLLTKTIKGLADGSIKETPQFSSLNFNPSTLKHAPKIFTETCKIDWNKSVDMVYDLIRGLAPYPAAYTLLNDKKLKIFVVKKITIAPTVQPGDFETDNKTFLQFACINGYIAILELQLEGKTKMNIQDFLRGWRF